MDILTRDQLWRAFLQKEPTRQQRVRRYLFGNIVFYLAMWRHYPIRALAEVAGCFLIFAAMAVILYLPEIAAWIDGVLQGRDFLIPFAVGAVVGLVAIVATARAWWPRIERRIR